MQIYVKRHVEKPGSQTRETIGATLKSFNVGFSICFLFGVERTVCVADF